MTTTHPVKIFQHSLVTRQSYLATNNQRCYRQHNLPHNVVLQNPDNSLEDGGRIFGHGQCQAVARQGCHYCNAALLPNGQICSKASLVRLQGCPRAAVPRRSKMYPGVWPNVQCSNVIAKEFTWDLTLPAASPANQPMRSCQPKPCTYKI